MSQLPVARGKAGTGIQKPRHSQIVPSTGSQLDLYAARKSQPSKPDATETLVVGDRVWVGRTKLGTIRYIGETKFAPGEWAGVELDESQGKTDGSVGGERYFSCPAMHGVFSRTNKLFRRNSVTSFDTAGVRKVSNERSMSFAGAPLNVGDRVNVASTMAGAKTGTLKYLGPTDFAKGEWAGVELDAAIGKNDGSVGGKRYFECEKNFGLFSPLHKVSKSPKMKMMEPSAIQATPTKELSREVSDLSNVSITTVESPTKKPQRRISSQAGLVTSTTIRTSTSLKTMKKGGSGKEDATMKKGGSGKEDATKAKRVCLKGASFHAVQDLVDYCDDPMSTAAMSLENEMDTTCLLKTEVEVDKFRDTTSGILFENDVDLIAQLKEETNTDKTSYEEEVRLEDPVLELFNVNDNFETLCEIKKGSLMIEEKLTVDPSHSKISYAEDVHLEDPVQELLKVNDDFDTLCEIEKGSLVIEENLTIDPSDSFLSSNSKTQKRQPRRNFRYQRSNNVNVKSSKPVQIAPRDSVSYFGSPEIELEKVINESDSHRDISVEDLIMEGLEVENKLVINEIKRQMKQNNESDRKFQEGIEDFHKNKDNIVSSFVKAAYGEKYCKTCGDQSSIHCSSCGNLCLQHDMDNHMENPFHLRYLNLTKLPPGLVKVSEGFINYPVLVPRKKPAKCNKCGADEFKPEVLDQKVKIFDLMAGCFLANRKGFLCSSCQSPYPLELEDLFEAKLYPINGSVESSTLFTFRTFDYYKLVKNENPGYGESNFIKVITGKSEVGMEPQTFSEAYQEYNSIGHHIDEAIKKEQNHDCPAILSNYTRVHTDGIHKLRRYDASFQLKEKNERSFFESDQDEGGPFLINDKFLSEEISVYKKHKMINKNGLYFCGTSKYTAGNNTEQKQNKFDEKGLQVASCSHYMYLIGANHHVGEIFCLNSILLSSLKKRGYNIKECNCDVACRYSQWNNRLNQNEELLKELKLDPTIKPDPRFCTGDFHAKSHVFPCKVKHGHNLNGIGRAAAGEEQEVLNFKLAKLSVTTRFMKPTKRNDTIQEFFYYENKKRNSEIVTRMINKEKSYKKDIRESEASLIKIESKLNVVINANSINVLRDAAEKCDTDLSLLEKNVEMSVVAVNVKKVQLKSTFDPSIKKKIRNNLSSATKDLHFAVNEYNKVNDIQITEESVVDGIFPWNIRHLPEECMSDPALFVKGCELYAKIQRSREEMDIIGHDLYSVIWKRFLDLEDIENELNSQDMFSDYVLAVKKERKEELIRQLEYEVVQIKSSSYSDILRTIPGIHLNKLSLGNSYRKIDSHDFGDLCVDIFNTVEDL